MSNRPDWTPGWNPARRGEVSPFGGDLPSELARASGLGTDAPPRVVRLEGGFVEQFPAELLAAPPKGLQRSEVIEPSDGWWRQKGAFGFRYQGQIPELAGTVIPLTEQLNLPGPPRQWWIHWLRYSRSLATEATPYGQWDLRGRVTYGVGGVQNVVEVDVMAGIQLPVIASSVKVDLVTYAPIVLADGSEPYDPGDVGVIAGAMFGDGSGGGALPATWSTQVFETQVDGSLTVDIPVPDFARSLALHTTQPVPASLAGVTISFNTPGVSEKVVNVQTLYDALTREKGIALPAHTNQVRLACTAAAGTIGERFSLQFFLAL